MEVANISMWALDAPDAALSESYRVPVLDWALCPLIILLHLQAPKRQSHDY
jgi:hypothetical protein